MGRKDNQLTFRLNGKKVEPVREEENTEDEHDQQEQSEETPPPVVNDKDKVIDFTPKKTQWKERRGPFWDDGNRTKSPGLPLKRKKKKTQRKSHPLTVLPTRIFAVIGGAVVLGLLFGMMLLHVLSGEAEDPPVSAELPENVNDATISSTVQGDFSVSFTQAGAFSTIEKGEEMKTNFDAEGYPTILTYDGELYYLFIGMAVKEQDAAVLNEYYHGEGKEIYEKSWTIPAVEAEMSNKAEEWLDQTRTVISEMTTVSLAGLEERNRLPEDWQSQWESYVSSYDSLTESLPEEADKLVKQLEETSSLLQSDNIDFEASQAQLMAITLQYEALVHALNGEEDQAQASSENKEENGE